MKRVGEHWNATENHGRRRRDEGRTVRGSIFMLHWGCVERHALCVACGDVWLSGHWYGAYGINALSVVHISVHVWSMLNIAIAHNNVDICIERFGLQDLLHLDKIVTYVGINNRYTDYLLGSEAYLEGELSSYEQQNASVWVVTASFVFSLVVLRQSIVFSLPFRTLNQRK